MILFETTKSWLLGEGEFMETSTPKHSTQCFVTKLYLLDSRYSVRLARPLEI